MTRAVDERTIAADVAHQRSRSTNLSGFNVVVCGGGIAGIEGLLRLRRLAGDSVQVTLVSPNEEFVYRPLAVREPFAEASARRYPLRRIVSDTGARWVRDRLADVDMAACKLHTGGGDEIPYDALLLALGARESAPYEHAHVFSDHDAGQSLREIVLGLQLGEVKSVAFVLPDWPAWPLPLYELALMTAEQARATGCDLQISFITPEGRPLKAFGQAAADAMARLLAEAGISLHTGVVAQVPAPQLVTFGETRLEVQRIVSVPKISGPAIPGIPAGTGWFVPIDDRCVVQDSGGRVFAAGDATDYPVKHGGIGAQQADTAAAGIAHLAGIGERPPPLQPVIRAMLLGGDRPLYLAARVVDGLGWRSQVYEQPPWPAEEKVVAEELGPYVRSLDAAPAER
jgi:sulfide:quinone oxidoreductase